jgi:hypothetical protein
MINKNIKNGDYREVFTFRDEDNNSPNKPKLLKDLVNTDATILAKVIASIFLKCVKSNVAVTGDPEANTRTFLVLKPKCLWLKISGNTIIDENNKPRQSISMFQDYLEYEKFKISFLQRPYSVSEILTAQGVDVVTNNIDNVWDLKYVFTYDLNEANRTRSASISAAGNTAINCVWL